MGKIVLLARYEEIVSQLKESKKSGETPDLDDARISDAQKNCEDVRKAVQGNIRLFLVNVQRSIALLAGVEFRSTRDSGTPLPH